MVQVFVDIQNPVSHGFDGIAVNAYGYRVGKIGNILFVLGIDGPVKYESCKCTLNQSHDSYHEDYEQNSFYT